MFTELFSSKIPDFRDLIKFCEIPAILFRILGNVCNNKNG